MHGHDLNEELGFIGQQLHPFGDEIDERLGGGGNLAAFQNIPAKP